MSKECWLEYASVGGNRHPGTADWDRNGSGVLAYTANNNIALWRPQDSDQSGVSEILAGHTDTVNVVKFLQPAEDDSTARHILVSASADKCLKLWSVSLSEDDSSHEIGIEARHDTSINCLAVLPGTSVVASGSADGIVRIWQLSFADDHTTCEVALLQENALKPRYIPLALDFTTIERDGAASAVLAVAGTKNNIDIFVSQRSNEPYKLTATLTGHEGWIRSLAFTPESDKPGSDLLLASASQDRYIRLWRIHQGTELPNASKAADSSTLGIPGPSLANKAHRFKIADAAYSVTFEALLLGHDDWIYTASWFKARDKLQLLTASADNSLAIWEADSETGVWLSRTRLGEISAQKGSTTATGSTGGFWTGLWSPDATAVACLGRTGGWRVWRQTGDTDRWEQDVGVTGHVKEVKSVAWSRDGSYLLSTGNDQTTRLHAQWKRDGKATWHEFSRPQIHGYDLSCLDVISDSQFVSGADEKLLRVFDEPVATAELLEKLSGVARQSEQKLPDAANIPVLGLSNKAVDNSNDNEETGESQAVSAATKTPTAPPTEDTLSRHTLWPEHEKLYGHGYEISCLATAQRSVDNGPILIATACKASSLDHAVIRIYSTQDWRELEAPLKAHSLTVTSLEFSQDGSLLLSVGRDRQWCVWQAQKSDDGISYEFVAQNPKGHSRMILDCSWAPYGVSSRNTEPVFATAGRDKSVKIWRMGPDLSTAENITTIAASLPITACAFLSVAVENRYILAYGLEDGSISVVSLHTDTLEQTPGMTITKQLLPSKTVNQLVWRPIMDSILESEPKLELAVASDDGSVRIYGIDGRAVLRGDQNGEIA